MRWSLSIVASNLASSSVSRGRPPAEVLLSVEVIAASSQPTVRSVLRVCLVFHRSASVGSRRPVRKRSLPYVEPLARLAAELAAGHLVPQQLRRGEPLPPRDRKSVV